MFGSRPIVFSVSSKKNILPLSCSYFSLLDLASGCLFSPWQISSFRVEKTSPGLREMLDTVHKQIRDEERENMAALAERGGEGTGEVPQPSTFKSTGGGGGLHAFGIYSNNKRAKIKPHLHFLSRPNLAPTKPLLPSEHTSTGRAAPRV